MDPAPIPDPVDAPTLALLTDEDFAELVRAHLTPRPGQRGAWDRLWRVLAQDEDLADRTDEVLQGFADAAAAALQDMTLDTAQAKRARSLIRDCEASQDRLDKVSAPVAEPLAWAGAAGALHPPRSRQVIATLVGAIAAHRASTPRPREADARLWAVLGRIGLDPRDHP